LFPKTNQAYPAVASAHTMAGQMIQSFQTFGIRGQLLWPNPRVGQPPALWYSVTAQLTVQASVVLPVAGDVRKHHHRLRPGRLQRLAVAG